MQTLIALVAAALFSAVGLGADRPLAWPQFRGPGGSGVAEGQKPPVELGPDKNVKWKVPAPSGLSSPDGAVTVLKAGSERPVVVAKNPQLSERTAATPAIADDTLYVRTEKHLYAFAETK